MSSRMGKSGREGVVMLCCCHAMSRGRRVVVISWLGNMAA
jgi:hypothetical protein